MFKRANIVKIGTEVYRQGFEVQTSASSPPATPPTPAATPPTPATDGRDMVSENSFYSHFLGPRSEPTNLADCVWSAARLLSSVVWTTELLAWGVIRVGQANSLTVPAQIEGSFGINISRAISNSEQ